MRHKLALSLVAAISLAASFGAGTASATVLCENNQTTGCTNDVAIGTSITFSAESSIMAKGPFGITIFTCTESTIEWTPLNTGSGTETVTGAIGKFTYGSCNRNITVNQSTTGTLRIQHIAGTDNGTVIRSDTTTLLHEIPFPFPSTCAYLTNNTQVGTLTGSLTTPTIDILGTISTETSGCPDVILEGSYVYTGSTPFIVGSS